MDFSNKTLFVRKMRANISSSRFFWLVASTLPAASLDAGAVEAALEEIIVTAQKRSESLQETPISLVAMGSEELETLAISEIDDLGGNIPNFRSTPHPNSATTPRVFIRGVGNFDDQITQDPSVAIYLDGVYLGRTQGMGMELADLQRIEVLRGPQGTLYGRNATGGAVNFITVAPNTSQWEFKQQVTLGNRNRQASKSMINTPLGDDSALKVYFLISRENGFIDNQGAGENRYGDERRKAGKVDFQWSASANARLRYAYDRSRIEDAPDYLSPTSLGQSAARPSRSHAGTQQIESNDATAEGHNLTAQWDLDERNSLKSISSYRTVDSYNYQDYLSGTGRRNTPFFVESWVDQNQFSQELQIIGDYLPNGVEYVVGLYYFEEKADGEIFNGLPGFGIRQYSYSKIDNSALAGYGELTVTPDQFDQRLHITPGIRWSRDRRAADLVRNNQLISNGQVISGSNQSAVGGRKFIELTPAITVTYDVSENRKLYAKINEGYKAGGFNIRASSIQFFQNGFGEESLRSYELGLKAEWLKRRVRTNIAVFESDYDDIQLNAQSDVSDPSKADILNAGGATIQGVEIDITAALTSATRLELNYGYLNARYDEITDGIGRDVTANYEFVNAPQHSYRLNLGWDIANTKFGFLEANINYTWSDDRFITSSTVNGKYIIESYGLTDVRLSLIDVPGVSIGRLRAAIWVKNLNDKEYAYLNGPPFGGITAWGDPRTYGIDFIYEI